MSSTSNTCPFLTQQHDHDDGLYFDQHQHTVQKMWESLFDHDGEGEGRGGEGERKYVRCHCCLHINDIRLELLVNID